MQHKPNLIKLAVQAAGGRSHVARALGIEPGRISGWQLRANIPAKMIKPLCALGGNFVEPAQLLDYIDQVNGHAMPQERAAA